jgi:fermentation-respiration switch protein FrsA (DUF1100 family)
VSRKAVIQVSILLGLFVAIPILFGCLLADNALHPATAAKYGPDTTAHQDVQIKGTGGTLLNASLYVPSGAHPNYVILLHGVSDTRQGMQRIARMLLRDNYAVLAPDSRNDLVTYGIREAPDVHLWADYLYRTQPVRNLYGLGESMGAAILLQALPLEPRFQAVVAECPFSTFTAIAHERIQQYLDSDAWVVRALAVPVVFSGFLYARARYGVDLGSVSPLDAVRHTITPILLIHGLRDNNISPQHSRTLLLANPRHITPWFVPKAGHVGAYGADPALFEQRVTTFFEAHQR